MATHRDGQQVGYDGPADAVVRPTARADDAPDPPRSALVVVIASEDSPTTRYASWLADTYETRLVRRGERMSTRLEADVVVVDQRTLTTARTRETVRGMIGPGRRDCRVLAPATVESCDGLADEYIPERIGRDGLLSRVETAMRMLTYDATVAELLSLTMRRRKLRTCSTTDRVDNDPDLTSLSERIDELHRRIDDGLGNVESQYAALLGRGHRRSTRQETRNESA